MATKTSKPTLIERRKTASENFDRSRPIEIHRTNQKVVTLTLGSVRHRTHGTKMTATIGQFNPSSTDDSDGVHINFDEDDLEVLAEALRRAVPVMTAEDDGRYIVARVEDGASVAPDEISALVAALSNNPTIFDNLAAKGDLNRLQEAISHLGRLATLKQSIAELEAAVTQGESGESFYQKWCERNSWAFGMTYLTADDIHTISRSDKVDLLLPRLFGGYRDIVELKTPSAKVLDKVRHFYALTKPAAEAIAQALHYTSRLQYHAYYLGGLQDAPHIRAHRSRAIVVIGSSAGWNDEMRQSWQEHNAALTDVQLWTFEELIECGKRSISVLSV